MKALLNELVSDFLSREIPYILFNFTNSKAVYALSNEQPNWIEIKEITSELTSEALSLLVASVVKILPESSFPNKGELSLESIIKNYNCRPVCFYFNPPVDKKIISATFMAVISSKGDAEIRIGFKLLE